MKHTSVAMVRVYTRRADAFADHAGKGLLSSNARTTDRQKANSDSDWCSSWRCSELPRGGASRSASGSSDRMGSCKRHISGTVCGDVRGRCGLGREEDPPHPDLIDLCYPFRDARPGVTRS